MKLSSETLDILADISAQTSQNLDSLIQKAVENDLDGSDRETILEYFDLFTCSVDGCIYHVDDLVYDIDENRCCTSNTIYCELSGNYFPDNQYSLISFGPYNRQFSNYYEDDIYNNGEVTLSGYTIVEVDGRLWDRDYAYYWESDGEYHTEPEPDYNFNYHGSNPWFKADHNAPKIGFEIEKEDLDAKESVYARDLQNRLGWGKENDGSLDSESGFELVSPVYSLTESLDYFKAEFEKLSDLINADYSSNCGGHINYSHPSFSSWELIDAIKGYFPLLYAIYTHRINSRWSKAKSAQKLIDEREKYQSVNIKNQCIEFRIFPAVKNVQNLLWRVELIQIIDAWKTPSPIQVIQYMSDLNHPLSIHLQKIFSLEKLFSKVCKVADFARQFEGITVPDRTISEIESKLILPDLLTSKK